MFPVSKDAIIPSPIQHSREIIEVGDGNDIWKDEGDICKDDANTAAEAQLEGRDGISSESRPERGHQVLLPDYPTNGVIGRKEPMSVNLFYRPNNSRSDVTDFKRQKFDFYETYEKKLYEKGIIACATPLPGLGYLYRDFKTVDIYKTDPTLPKRFQNPDLLHGYGCEREEHPLFRTTTSEYGKFGPTVHDVPREYHGLKNTFTRHLSSTGMPKNRSLNIK